MKEGDDDLDDDDRALPRNPDLPDYDPNAAIDAWADAQSNGDPIEHERLRRHALRTPSLRAFFSKGPSALTRTSPMTPESAPDETSDGSG